MYSYSLLFGTFSFFLLILFAVMRLTIRKRLGAHALLVKAPSKKTKNKEIKTGKTC